MNVTTMISARSAEFTKNATTMMNHGATTAITAAAVQLPAYVATAANTAPLSAPHAAKNAPTATKRIYAPSAASA